MQNVINVIAPCEPKTCLIITTNVLLHTIVCFYVISECRSHRRHYFLVQNSYKCKPTHTSIKSTSNVDYVIKNNTKSITFIILVRIYAFKLVFHLSMETTFIVLVRIYAFKLVFHLSMGTTFIILVRIYDFKLVFHLSIPHSLFW